MGVKAFYKMFKHDGVRGPNHATVFSDRGGGVRAPVVFYNRSNEAAQQLKAGDFDWDSILAGGCRIFHSGGIFAALSPTTPGVSPALLLVIILRSRALASLSKYPALVCLFVALAQCS
eukprot:SAG31_NODE_5398_length_2560_cov_2.708537_4_plen_118_part_00